MRLGLAAARGSGTLLLLGAACFACAPGPAGPEPPPGAEWRAARAMLESVREDAPVGPYGVVVRVTLREPRTGRSFTARGALAVDPRRALRMILLGPGGATAIDAWVTPAAYRFEVPPIGLLRRGGGELDATLPVEFFRWWFLGPLEGRLLASYAGPRLEVASVGACAGRWFVLRRAASTVTLCDQAPGGPSLDILALERTASVDPRAAGRGDRLSFHGVSLTPHAGDRADYEEASSGVRAHVEIESLDADAPDPIAFLDPDHGGAR